MCGDSRGLPLDSPRLPSHMGWLHESTVGGGNGGVSVRPLGDRQFRAFSVRDKHGCDGRVWSSTPRVVLRSENAALEIRIKILTRGFEVSGRVEIQPGGDANRAS